MFAPGRPSLAGEWPVQRESTVTVRVVSQDARRTNSPAPTACAWTEYCGVTAKLTVRTFLMKWTAMTVLSNAP